MVRKLTIFGCSGLMMLLPYASNATDDLRMFLNNIEEQMDSENTLDALLKEMETLDVDERWLSAHINNQDVELRDVPRDEWFSPFILALTDLEIVSGYRDNEGKTTGLFGPANPVTHAEAIKIALGAAGVDENSCNGILAHPQAINHWAKQYIICAQQFDFGITSEVDLNTSASRAEVLRYIIHAFKIEAPEDDSPFEDTKNHSEKDIIAYAAKHGIISGDTDAKGNPLGTFRPNDPVNRAEVAKIVVRAMRVW